MKCNFKTCLKNPKLTTCCLKIYRGKNKFILEQRPKKTIPKVQKNLYFHVNYLSGNGKSSDCYQKGYILDRSNLQLENMYNTYIDMINTIESQHTLTDSYTLSHSLIFLIYDQNNNITNFSQLFLKYAIKNPTLLIPSSSDEGYDGTTTIINNGYYEDILPQDEFERLIMKLINKTDSKSQIFAYLDPRLELAPFNTLISATFETILNLITINNEDIFGNSYISINKPDITSTSVIFDNLSSTMYPNLYTPNNSCGCVYKFDNLTAWSNLSYNYCSILINEESFAYPNGGVGQQMIRRNNVIIHEDNPKLSFLRNINGEYDFMTVYKINDTTEVPQTYNYNPCFIDMSSYVYLLNYPYGNQI